MSASPPLFLKNYIIMAAPPLPPKIIGRVRAIYAYCADEQSALNFQKGDYIDVLAKLESGWWDGW